MTYEEVLEEDSVRLMTKEEFYKYKDKIPPMMDSWCLIADTKNCVDSNCDKEIAVVANMVGDQYFCSGSSCKDAIRAYRAVRPVIKSSALPYVSRYIQRAFYMGATWIRISDDLFISEMPIGFSPYNQEECNYEESAIRKFILDWYEDRN